MVEASDWRADCVRKEGETHWIKRPIIYSMNRVMRVGGRY